MFTNHSHADDSKETDYTYEYEINVVYEYECTQIIVIVTAWKSSWCVELCHVAIFRLYDIYIVSYVYRYHCAQYSPLLFPLLL